MEPSVCHRPVPEPPSSAHRPCNPPPRGQRGDRCPCLYLCHFQAAVLYPALDDEKTTGCRPSLLPHVLSPPPAPICLSCLSSCLRPSSPGSSGGGQCWRRWKSRAAPTGSFSPSPPFVLRSHEVPRSLQLPRGLAFCADLWMLG